jgi:hypothetical protein
MLVENLTVSFGPPPGSLPQAAGLVQVVFPNFK